MATAHPVDPWIDLLPCFVDCLTAQKLQTSGSGSDVTGGNRMATTKKRGSNASSDRPAKGASTAARSAKDSKSNADLERIKRLIRAKGETLLNLPNVTGVGVGFKVTGASARRSLRCSSVSTGRSFPRRLRPKGFPPSRKPSSSKVFPFRRMSSSASTNPATSSWHLRRRPSGRNASTRSAPV